MLTGSVQPQSLNRHAAGRVESKHRGRNLLFEPWSLGDAIIAAAVAREDEERLALACDVRWVPFVRAGLPRDSVLSIVGVHLPYTMRGAQRTLAVTESLDALALPFPVHSVLNIRGDLRDYQAAHKLFPGVPIRQNGWFSFFARRSRILDEPVRCGLIPVRNRYRAWARLAGIPYRVVARRYETGLEQFRSTVVIHVGAQWRSKQYPYASQLQSSFRDYGIDARLIRGPGDALPAGVPSSSCPEVAGPALAACFQGARLVISNDSGPMHLAAYLGCRTLCVASVSNLYEWIPPGVCAVTSPDMPGGYRPLPHYMSDRPISRWPAPEDVLAEATRLLGESRTLGLPFEPPLALPGLEPVHSPAAAQGLR